MQEQEARQTLVVIKQYSTLPCLWESLNILELERERRRLILVKVGVVVEPGRRESKYNLSQHASNYELISYLRERERENMKRPKLQFRKVILFEVMNASNCGS